MESKRMVLLMTMMIVMAMGNLLNQTEAVNQTYPFGACYPNCFFLCPFEKGFPKALICPLSCIKTCMNNPGAATMSLEDNTNHNDYYCKLGCATHHCAPLSSPTEPNVDKVVECVGSCTDKCSPKN